MQMSISAEHIAFINKGVEYPPGVVKASKEHESFATFPIIKRILLVAV